ncbi:F-box/FBD/LRR-repeat protein At1g13570-like [Mercurialis annua]|uniref:F-box/FBD/LRR-repeat protein At1g13570-like n=1 Tax=Mercurialis annua TaxID=3986 RepID=UPI00215E485A|nr:F-box/FBD/LRR-repeat protein At1g13570-like [Mercurialis annua]XP_050224287.1 F-box/FBD/LRR-repeat protein At1g13570-like [Mercurialis annua]
MVKQQMKTMDNHHTKKIKRSSRADRISNLPSHIIDKILICLPIKEAVKTSVLSTKWRFNWRYLSKLVFDGTLIQTSGNPSTENRSITKPFFDMYKVLLLHRGSIFHFSLRIPTLNIYPEINQLMLYLSEKDVQEIMFKVFSCSTSVPSYLFSCVTLRSLDLSICKFKAPSAFQGFVKLISLRFEAVHFETDVFETFISKCPLLERLSIIGCDNTSSLHIDIPYLKFFHFMGRSSSICFRKTSQHLSTVIFDGYNAGPSTYEPTKLLECAPVIKHLHLGPGYVDWLLYGTMWRKLSLGCLRVVEVPRLCFGFTDTVSSVLYLIVSAPNLEKLDIGFLMSMDDIQPLAPELLKVEDLLDNALKKLRVVNLRLSHRKEVKSDLEFIKFILAESVVLEKMSIRPAFGTVAKILKQILRLQRSSKKAEILFLDP